MGQAKLRGSKEQRVAEGVHKRAQEAVERDARRKAHWASLTPRQRQKAAEVASMVAMFTSVADPYMHVVETLQDVERENKRLASIP